MSRRLLAQPNQVLQFRYLRATRYDGRCTNQDRALREDSDLASRAREPF